MFIILQQCQIVKLHIFTKKIIRIYKININIALKTQVKTLYETYNLFWMTHEQ